MSPGAVCGGWDHWLPKKLEPKGWEDEEEQRMDETCVKARTLVDASLSSRRDSRTARSSNSTCRSQDVDQCVAAQRLESA